ncbi:DegT/DnrJ/EryC1/StrS family aminotransferase, partial [Parabacteroides distasonis]
DDIIMGQAEATQVRISGKVPGRIASYRFGEGDHGMPYDCDRIMEVANRSDIPVIEDAAEGVGSKYTGQGVGTFGCYGVLSCTGTTRITTSGGGAGMCPAAEPG